MPNYRFYSGELSHSTGNWKNHKYLKKIGNHYIYAKRALQTRRNLKTAEKELDEARARQALSTNPNYQRTYAAEQKRNELQRQYNRTFLGRAENGFRAGIRRLTAGGPKRAHRISTSHRPSTAIAGEAGHYEVNDKKKKKKK